MVEIWPLFCRSPAPISTFPVTGSSSRRSPPRFLRRLSVCRTAPNSAARTPLTGKSKACGPTANRPTFPAWIDGLVRERSAAENDKLPAT